MGRSTASCFKIITCTNTENVNEDGFERIQDFQNNGSTTDKRRWSFRKKSDRHRVVGNTVVEASPNGSRGNQEATSIDFQVPTSPIVEKISPVEVIPFSGEMNLKAPEPIPARNSLTEGRSISIEKDAAIIEPRMEESFAIVIQAAIRGYLSRKALLKIKNVVKLQAAVRGHIVRSQALGTLRCVQAIAKLQTLVRARRIQNDQDELLGKEIIANPSCYCTEKILENVFARQLLESTPKKRPINIKCDPLRPDSAWKWMERWMSVSSPDTAQPQKLRVNLKIDGQISDISTGINSDVPDLESSHTQSAVRPGGEDNLTINTEKIDSQFCEPTASVNRDESQQSEVEDVGLSEAEEISSKIRMNEAELPLNITSEAVPDANPVGQEADDEQLTSSTERFPLELEGEGPKIVIGSRKASNPAFIAAQSKFEELSSASVSRMPVGSSNPDVGVKLKLESLPSAADFQIDNKDTIKSANTTSHEPEIDVGDLEYGSKHSSSSIIESIDRTEVPGGERESENRIMEEVTFEVNSTSDNPSGLNSQDVGYPVFVSPEKLEITETSVSEERSQHDNAIDQPAYGSSPEGSPRSHATAPESQGTPSSQVLMKAKRKESNKSDHSQKRKSLSAGKRSPSNPKSDIGMRNSMEKLPKDLKNGKRRNSFGLAKTDHADQDPREESNSSSLPSYMQATESARAKAQANISPRSSPDVQENDFHIKKRHSLPNANGKQGSPRVPSALPQAPQIAKGDQPHSSRDRWQR